MGIISLISGLLLLCTLSQSILRHNHTPEQIHLAPGSEPDSMTVSWVTYLKASQSLAKFRLADGVGRYVTTVGKQKNFSYDKNRFYTHYVTLRKLAPNTLYSYKVGSEDGWSEVYTFKSLPRPGSVDSFKVCIFGDLAAGKRGIITPFLIQAARTRQFDLIIHAGDIAYNFYSGKTGNFFLNDLQEVFAQIPYIIAIGNHEREKDHAFHNVKHRFKMPNSMDGSNQFYSVDIGPVHFVAASTELYQYKENAAQANQQYKWLSNDLKGFQQSYDAENADPQLKKLAQNILAIPASSSRVERLFSKICF
uniref:Purple acid phosphatase n=1 Tax=Ditylenchus dipsaci TaxID=166011 RepID=A0A915ELW7_9BILA